MPARPQPGPEMPARPQPGPQMPALPGPGAWPARPARSRCPAARRHLVILGGYLAAGVASAWPRASYLAHHRLPATRDAAAYVWCFGWVAQQLGHLSSLWFTRYLASPVGTQLGLHVLMPLEGVVMAPITVAFGPSASYNLLSAAVPGLLCYGAYRVAIASDHSGPIVVEFPFGICGGTPTCGAQFAPEAQVLATADGHPRAVGFIARVPAQRSPGSRRTPCTRALSASGRQQPGTPPPKWRRRDWTRGQ